MDRERVERRRDTGVTDDRVWQLLEKCWRTTPRGRLPIIEAYHTLKSCPKVIHTPWSPSAIRELPRTLQLHVLGISIKFSKDSKNQKSWQQFYVRLKYGNRNYETSLTNLKNNRGGYTWFVLHLLQLLWLPLSLM